MESGMEKSLSCDVNSSSGTRERIRLTSGSVPLSTLRLASCAVLVVTSVSIDIVRGGGGGGGSDVWLSGIIITQVREVAYLS